MISHCIPEDDLIFYALDELDDQEKQHVEMHLLICPECRTRIGQYRQIRQDLLQSVSTDPVHPHKRRRIWTTKSARWSIVAMVLVLAVAIAMVSIDDVAGQFPFARQVGLAPTDVGRNINDFVSASNELPGISIRDSLDTRDTGKAVPTGWHVPEALPLGLYLDDSYVLDDGSVGFYYLSRDYGLEIVILLEDAETSRTRIPEGRATLITLGNIEMLVDQNSPSSANGVLWLEDDLLLSVSIARTFGGLTITPEQLLEVVDAVIQGRAG